MKEAKDARAGSRLIGEKSRNKSLWRRKKKTAGLEREPAVSESIPVLVCDVLVLSSHELACFKTSSKRAFPTSPEI
jgi:hypothetical protein